MASVRKLKQEINNVLGDIIEAVYIWQLTNPEESKSKSDKIIDEAIQIFDELIEKMHQPVKDSKKAHFQGIRKELETKGRKLIDALNAL